ncbi:hypothetical protein [Burkholderia sp. WP9]|uniref:hypothetical protein n=1 Tax=Burkholderia sp. WP9 TaxID=1500263 RepID=UPI00115F798E|nr:hypothetical protein [Burkholderia sp. WP9]
MMLIESALLGGGPPPHGPRVGPSFQLMMSRLPNAELTADFAQHQIVRSSTRLGAILRNG